MRDVHEGGIGMHVAGEVGNTWIALRILLLLLLLSVLLVG